jgi:deoxyribodipyrimidine photolyase
LDGRDPNGFTGVGWCFGKHDRPWGERPIFGNVRYMNDKGLKRKFDADRYVKMMTLDKKDLNDFLLIENQSNRNLCLTDRTEEGQG